MFHNVTISQSHANIKEQMLANIYIDTALTCPPMINGYKDRFRIAAKRPNQNKLHIILFARPIIANYHGNVF